MSDFKFKKRYGQNFLTNEKISDEIANSINASQNDLIIEIGPGGGAITKKIKKYNAQIIAFEIDKETSKYLDKLVDSKTKIVYEDFLESNVGEEIKNHKYDNLYIIGNLPYYITTPIIERILNLQLNPKSITIMVQKEVGERFLARPKQKEYGYMTVLLNYWYNLEKIIDVDRRQFIPEPNVDSMVLKLIRKEHKQVDYEKFIQITKESFQFKRKTIGNNLKKYNKNKLNEILSKYDATTNCRAEELALDVFIDLANLL